jgi:hypothetical protein
MVVAGGLSTGVGKGGGVIFKTSNSATSTGSGLNSLIERTRIAAKDTTLTESTATAIATFTLANSKFCGLRVSATTHADDGSNFQCVRDLFNVAMVNKAGTVTIGTLSSNITSTAVSSGTLTTAWTVTASGTTVSVKNSAVSSLTQTTLQTSWRIDVDTDDTALAIAPQ